jgi:hypothetical protein
MSKKAISKNGGAKWSLPFDRVNQYARWLPGLAFLLPPSSVGWRGQKANASTVPLSLIFRVRHDGWQTA